MRRNNLGKWVVLTGTVVMAVMVRADETSNGSMDNPAPANNTVPPVAQPLTAQQFVNDASMGGMKEVYISQMALEKSGNQDVKDLANHMIADHTKADTKLAKIAGKEGLTCPDTNTFSATDPNWNNTLLTRTADNTKGEEAQMLIATNFPYLSDYQDVRQLRTLSGDQFDRTYADVMVQDHNAAISEFQLASDTLSDKSLKQFATKTLPTLRKHQQMVNDLDNKLTNPGASTPSNASNNQPPGTSAMGYPPIAP